MIAVAFVEAPTAPASGEVGATATTTTPLVAFAKGAAAPGSSLPAAAVMLATSRTTTVVEVVASKVMLGSEFGAVSVMFTSIPPPPPPSMADDGEGDGDDNDDDWGAMVNGAKEDEPAGTAQPSSSPSLSPSSSTPAGGIGVARGGTENAPKCPSPASSRFPWTKRCWAYPPHVLQCASQCRRSRSTLALESGRRRCSVLDERYREDMPRARRRVSGGSPLGWGCSPTFTTVADTTEVVAAGWAGGPGIIAIGMVL
jgi:hypothetical protein